VKSRQSSYLVQYKKYFVDACKNHLDFLKRPKLPSKDPVEFDFYQGHVIPILELLSSEINKIDCAEDELSLFQAINNAMYYISKNIKAKINELNTLAKEKQIKVGITYVIQSEIKKLVDLVNAPLEKVLSSLTNKWALYIFSAQHTNDLIKSHLSSAATYKEYWPKDKLAELDQRREHALGILSIGQDMDTMLSETIDMFYNKKIDALLSDQTYKELTQSINENDAELKKLHNELTPYESELSELTEYRVREVLYYQYYNDPNNYISGMEEIPVYGPERVEKKDESSFSKEQIIKVAELRNNIERLQLSLKEKYDNKNQLKLKIEPLRNVISTQQANHQTAIIWKNKFSFAKLKSCIDNNLTYTVTAQDMTALIEKSAVCFKLCTHPVITTSLVDSNDLTTGVKIRNNIVNSFCGFMQIADNMSVFKIFFDSYLKPLQMDLADPKHSTKTVENPSSTLLQDTLYCLSELRSTLKSITDEEAKNRRWLLISRGTLAMLYWCVNNQPVIPDHLVKLVYRQLFPHSDSSVIIPDDEMKKVIQLFGSVTFSKLDLSVVEDKLCEYFQLLVSQKSLTAEKKIPVQWDALINDLKKIFPITPIAEISPISIFQQPETTATPPKPIVSVNVDTTKLKSD
jgi:hypothetical protein